ncbi:MAG: bifunctional phosphoglucose/phosphomannose isomerase [bacterium]
MTTLNCNIIAQFDSQGMLNLILRFPQQLQDAQNISKENNIDFRAAQISNICATGMGGSAISGDIVRSYLTSILKVPFFVNRYYSLPNFVDENSLVIVSSYSGNTEETLSAYADACKRKAKIVCITSGGALAEMAQANKHPLFLIPMGYPPRAALGYLTVPFLYCLHFAGIISDPEEALLETITLLNSLSKDYHPDIGQNLPKQIAYQLKGKIPLIYASVYGFEAVAWRWKGQLSENSEVLAYCNFFSELNHNEIMGWGPLQELNHNFQIIYLNDRDYPVKIRKRMTVTKDIIEKQTAPIIEVESTGSSLLSRIFSLIFLGDMVSLYLAVLNQVDPSPVQNIDYLKHETQIRKS